MSIFEKFKLGFTKSANKFAEGFKEIIIKKEIDDKKLDEIEEFLISSDVGIESSSKIKSIISKKKIDPNLTYYETSYSHPIYDSNTLNAQTKLNAIQGNNGLYFAGAKMGFGFHEDGLNSGLKVAKLLGCEPSWSERKI